jgi:hypothetical protein
MDCRKKICDISHYYTMQDNHYYSKIRVSGISDLRILSQVYWGFGGKGQLIWREVVNSGEVELQPAIVHSILGEIRFPQIELPTAGRRKLMWWRFPQCSYVGLDPVCSATTVAREDRLHFPTRLELDVSPH